MHPYAAPLPVSDQDEWVHRRDIPSRTDDLFATVVIGVMASLGYWKACELIFMLDAWAKASQ